MGRGRHHPTEPDSGRPLMAATRYESPHANWRLPSRTETSVLVLLILCGVSSLLLAQELMEWESSFPPIALDAITTQDGVSTGSSTATLLLNGDAEISADNSAAAQLSGPGSDTLVTEYKLTFDGDGQSATGGPSVDYTPYDSFLIPPVQITHLVGDDEVDVTVYVRAQNRPAEVADAGGYSATATLTVAWVGF